MTEGQTFAEAPLIEKPNPHRKLHRVKPTSRPSMRPQRINEHPLTSTENDSVIIQANNILQKRITQLTNDIGIEPDKKFGSLKMIKYRKEISELEGLQFVLQANGELSPFLKKAELTRLTTTTQDQTIKEVLDAIEPQANAATTKFYDILRKNGVENDIISTIDRDPSTALTTNKEIIKRLSNLHLQQYFFSSSTPSDAEVNAMTNRLKPEQQTVLDDEEKKTGKPGKLSLLLLMLISPLLMAGAAIKSFATKAFGKGQQ